MTPDTSAGHRAGRAEPVRALLEADGVARLRDALRSNRYTVDGVSQLLGPAASAALARGDSCAATLAIGEDDPRSVLVRLFLLGLPVPPAAVAAALAPLSVEEAVAAGLLRATADGVRAALEVRPYAEAGADGDWWVVSDLGADVSGGPLRRDHVLGVGAAATTLAQAVPRRPAASALDLGTGCGVQALHLSGHCDHVVATDLSRRALRLAATTAALSGVEFDLRQGDLTEPVSNHRFDLVVANPPFVVGPADGAGGAYDYRDSGRAGDEITRILLHDVPPLLEPDGTASLLANWVITAEQAWEDRLGGWLAGSGCDAWVWQREVAEPAQYVALWLRDAGLDPSAPDYPPAYERWTGWLAERGVLAVGMGLISLRRRDSPETVTVCEDVAQAIDQPCGPSIAAWFDRADRLRNLPDERLWSTALSVAPDVRLITQAAADGSGWTDVARELQQLSGLRWTLDCDEAVATLVGGCDGRVPLGLLVDVYAAALGVDRVSLGQALRPVIEDLLRRGFVDVAEVTS